MLGQFGETRLAQRKAYTHGFQVNHGDGAAKAIVLAPPPRF